MLVIPLKPAVRFDIMAALAEWLDNSDQQVSFQPTNPLQLVLPKPDFSSVACRDDLLRLQALRHCLSDCLLKPNSHKAALEERAFEDSQEYHAVLLEFERRGFPTLDDEHNGLRLVWKGAWAPQQERHATLLWDRAVITFNIAALLTSKAAECSVTDRDQCKQAVGHLQQAASVLNILKDFVQSQDFATVDLSQSMLTYWEKYCLAEAQTYIYRMAALGSDDTKHGTLSFLAQSSHQLFNDALAAVAQDARLQSEVPRQASAWASYCKANSILSSSKAEFHQASQHRVQQSWGKEIARLRECLTKLQACSDFFKSLREEDDPEVLNAVEYATRECQSYLPVVQDRLTEAERDNYRIYQDEIPDSLPEITPKQLAKSSGGYPPSMMVPQKALFLNV